MYFKIKNISLKKCPLTGKGVQVDYKNIKLLKDMFLKMVKYYHQELLLLVKKTEIYPYQLKS